MSISLDDDCLAMLLRSARAIPDDDLRGDFFAAVADVLRPLPEVEQHDMRSAIGAARKRLGAAA